MARAGTAYIDFEGNFGSLHKQVNSQLKPLSGRFSKIGKVAAAGIGVGMVALVKEGASAVQAFQEAEKVGAQTAAVLKSTGNAAGISAKGVGQLATAISRKSGLDDEAIQSGENLLLTFTNVRNETGKGNQIFSKATGIMADMSTALGQDMKSSAIQVGKALNDPIKGVTALQRVGVSFTASQKDQIKTLLDSGRTLDAQKLIMRELNKEFGGSAAAFGKTGAGQVAKLKTEFGNLQEMIGARLAPVLTKVVVKVREFIQGINDGKGAGGRFAAAVAAGFDRAKQAIAPFARQIGSIFSDSSLNVGEKLGKVFQTAAPVIVGAAAKVFAQAAPRAVSAFIGVFQSAGPWGRLFVLGALLSKLGVFQAAGRAAASKFVDAFGKNLKFAGVIGGVLALMAIFGRFTGATKSAAEASRDLADAVDAERDAIRRLADHDLDLAQARAQVRASALTVERAEKDLTTARKQSGKNSLAARESENNLEQARIQHKRAVRELGDAERHAATDRRGAEGSVNDMRKSQLEAKVATEGWDKGVQNLGRTISLLPARKQVTIDVNVQQAVDRVNAAKQAIADMLAMIARVNASTVKPKGKGASAGGLLFPLEAERVRLEGLLARVEKFWAAHSTKRKSELTARAHLGQNLGDFDDKKQAQIEKARRQLKTFKDELEGVSRLKDVRIALRGVEKTLAFNTALKDLRAQIGGKLTEAMDKFHDKWEQTIGKDLDRANQAALSAFDAATQDLITSGPAAQALRALQATEAKITDERTDAQEQAAIDEARAAILAAKTADEKAAAQKQLDDALFQAAETDRQRKITAAQTAAEAERVTMEADRAAARTALEDQQQAEREARYVADSAAFQKLLQTQLDAEYAQLAQRKENYKRWATDVARILKKAGLASPLSLDFETEAALNQGGGKRKQQTNPRSVAAPQLVVADIYIGGQKIDERATVIVRQEIDSRDRQTARTVSGGVG